MLLARNLITSGQIRTSVVRAKVIRQYMDTLVTLAKRASNMDKARLMSELSDRKSEHTLLAWGKTRFANRTSGFTTIVRLGARLGDNTEEAFLRFVDPVPVEAESSKEKKDVKKLAPSTAETKKKTVTKKPKAAAKKKSAKKKS